MAQQILKNNLLLSFYGDDFTGSTDSMEALAINGIPTALFLEPPSEEMVKNFRLKRNISQAGEGELWALGVAGISRSLAPQEMEKELPSLFQKIADLKAPAFHYKTCSTFDSSPTVGNIGKAAEIAKSLMKPDFIPLMIATPSLKRFIAFGNLFATVGNDTFRIDRHPTMSRHPITPMDEGDIRLHLARQTKIPTYNFDLLHQSGTFEQINQRFKKITKSHDGFILFDCLNTDQLRLLGRLVWENRGNKPLVIFGASGVEYALVEWWMEEGTTTRPETIVSPGPSKQLLVMSGSCSPVTEKQITWGLENHYHGIPIDTAALVNPETCAVESRRIVTESLNLLQKGKDVIIYSALGPDDPMINRTKDTLQKLDLKDANPSHILGSRQSEILKNILEHRPLKRLVVAGGDTSGYVLKDLDIYALEAIMPLSPGSPLCLAHSNSTMFDGMEIVLKGGQVGDEYFLSYVKTGKVGSK